MADNNPHERFHFEPIMTISQQRTSNSQRALTIADPRVFASNFHASNAAPNVANPSPNSQQGRSEEGEPDV
jgi:hypothetical protein